MRDSSSSGVPASGIRPFDRPIVAFCLTFGLATLVGGSALIGQDTDMPPELAAKLVVAGIRQNLAALQCGVLEWTRLTQENGFIQDRVIESSGHYRMWWDGVKVRAQSEEEQPASTPEGYTLMASSRLRTFDGVECRTTSGPSRRSSIAILPAAKYSRNENWFEVVGLFDAGLAHFERLLSGKLPNVSLACTVVMRGNERLLRCVTAHPDDKAHSESLFDLDKGCNLVEESWYNKAGQLYMKRTIEYSQVAGNAWLPTKSEARSFEAGTDKVTLLNRYEVDMQSLVCNDRERAGLTDDLFTIPIEEGMQVFDYRGGPTAIKYVYHTVPDAGDVLSAIESRENVGTASSGPTSLPRDGDTSPAVVPSSQPAEQAKGEPLAAGGHGGRKHLPLMAYIALACLGIGAMALGGFLWVRQRTRRAD